MVYIYTSPLLATGSIRYMAPEASKTYELGCSKPYTVYNRGASTHAWLLYYVHTPLARAAHMPCTCNLRASIYPPGVQEPALRPELRDLLVGDHHVGARFAWPSL